MRQDRWSFWIRGALVAVVAAGSPVAASEPLEEIASAYREIRSVEARFRQTSAQAAFGRESTAAGRTAYEKGNIRWDYEYPHADTYVVTPESVLWVQPTEHQVVKVPASEAFATNAPAALLGGMADIQEHFRLDEVLESTEEVLVVRLRPTFEDPQVARVVLTFDRQQGVVTSLEMIDAFDNRNRFVFEEIVLNEPVPDTRFHFDPPAGFQVFEPAAGAAGAERPVSPPTSP